jgi:NitT/TauT family transport system ATP-binding protein
VEHVALLKQIKRALDSKSDHTLPDDFFHDILDEHFTEEETLRQLDTAINWGRYAELFDHDSERKRFFIPDETAAEPQNMEVGTET